jgi:hypothetical protein
MSFRMLKLNCAILVITNSLVRKSSRCRSKYTAAIQWVSNPRRASLYYTARDHIYQLCVCVYIYIYTYIY